MRKITICMMAVVAIFFVSCNSKSDVGGFIPDDAAMVFHINSKSLSSKLSWKEIQETDWFKEHQKDESDSLAQKIMQDPANSGIDTEKDLFFFVKNSGRYSYFSLQGSVKDASAFEAFCKKTMKSSEVTQKDGLSAVKSDEGGVMTWKNNHFIFVSSMPNFSGFGSIMRNPSMDENYDYDSRKQPADSLVAYAASLFSLKGKNSLASDSRFTALVNTPGDLHYWMNGENFYSGMMGNILSLTKLSTLLKGNIQTGTINFDNGKITVKSKAYYNKELNDLYKKYKAKNIDADALAKISSQNVIGVVAVNYPPDGIKEFVKLLGVDGFVNSFFGEMNYSFDEFIKANKGDIILSVSDLESKKVTETYSGPDGQSFPYERKQIDLKVLFATSINDKAAFDKLAAITQEQLGKAAARGMPGNFPQISFNVTDQWFVAGNSKEQVDAFTGGNKTSHEFIEKIKGYPIGVYIDLQKVFDGMAPLAEGEEGEIEMFGSSRKIWQNVVMTSDMFEGTVEINLVDKNTNSLKQLNSYLNDISKSMNARRNQFSIDVESPVRIDTVSVQPVPGN